MTVVTDAGPLIALGKLGVLPLLHDLYGVVLLPPAVHDEVVVQGLALGEPDAVSTQFEIARDRLRVTSIAGADLPDTVRSLPLDRGELEAIALALQESADRVLLDDLEAREYARRLGLSVAGTLGVLVEAHRRAIVTRVEIDVLMQAILNRDDIWISQVLVRRVWDDLRQAGRDQ
jgi:uncharacterized protein